MAVEELLVYFLGVPAVAYAAGALWLRRTMRKVGERRLGFLREPSVNSRFFVYLALLSTPIVLGGAVLIQAFQPTQETSASSQVLRVVGWTFALAASLASLSEAWVVVHWKEASFGDIFPIVLVLALIPEIELFCVFMTSIRVLALTNRDSTQPPISPTLADAVVRSLEILMIGTLGAPLSAFLSNRQPMLNRTTWSKVLFGAVLGTVPVIVSLLLALSMLPRS